MLSVRETIHTKNIQVKYVVRKLFENQ